MSESVEPADVGSTSQKRVPDFFIVGHAKSGTTALYEMLRRHPQIYMSDVKEPMFFARDPQSSPKSRGVKTFSQTGKREETLDQYLSLFTAAQPDQLIGEASTSYLWSSIAPAKIAQAQPAARIVAILREPVSFMRSLHLQMLQNHTETEKDLRKALALEEARRQGRGIPRNSYWPAALIYSDRVRYVEQLRRYHAAFSPEQVLTLIYEDFRGDNEVTVRSVLRFLGVDETAPVESVNANPTVGVRAARVGAMVRTVRAEQGPVSQAVKRTVKGLTSGRVRAALLHPLRSRVVYGDPQPLDQRLMLELRHRFKGEVEAISEYLDRDLVSLWGYDSLG